MMKKSGLGALVLALAISGDVAAQDGRATMMSACETQRGIGWLKRNHGERYCDCWADQAKEVLSAENHATLLKATEAELEAADKADREKIRREHTELYSTVSRAAKSCARKR